MWWSFYPAQAWAVEWIHVSGIEESHLNFVAADPSDPRVVLTSSERRLYRSGDGGNKWKKVASVRGQDVFRKIVFHGAVRGAVLAVSEKTLYSSVDSGQVWKRWRKPFGKARMICAAYADEGGDLVHVGTDEGLYTLDLRTGTVESAAGLARVPVLGIGPGSDASFVVVTPPGIYRLGPRGWQLEQPLGKRNEQAEGGGGVLEQYDLDEMAIVPINAFVIHRPVKPLTLVSTPRGVLAQGSGQAWTQLRGTEALRGLSSADVGADAVVYLAGKDGVYRWEEASGQTQDASKGLAGALVLDLDYQPASDTLYTATDRGLYRAVYVSASGQTLRTEVSGGTPPAEPTMHPPSSIDAAQVRITEQDVLKRFAREPSVTAVQEHAIRYAEVHPDKIAAWRRAAARKALLPSVSIGWDRDTNQTVDLDRGGTGDPDHFIIGPEENSMDWSVRIGWDLGDLIWNDDQTSIDTRSKLMAELRDDVLNEVTHAYFERRRLQAETVLLPGREVGTRLERELRTQELTAQIDALTGGWFSAVIQCSLKEVPGHAEPQPGA